MVCGGEMIIELRNCDVEVHYIGTREEIAFQMVQDFADEFGNSVRALAYAIDLAADAFDRALWLLIADGLEVIGNMFVVEGRIIREILSNDNSIDQL
jgi:hypothetical protein